MKIKYIVVAAIILVILFAVPLDREMDIRPSAAMDSDGKFSEDIINQQKSSEYFLMLKTFPYGYVEINWSAGDVKDAEIIAEWTAVKGSGNIYAGYYDNGWVEQGPFNGGDSVTLHPPAKDQIRFRLRGEDLDFGVDAMAWVRTRLLVKKQIYGIAGLML